MPGDALQWLPRVARAALVSAGTLLSHPSAGSQPGRAAEIRRQVAAILDRPEYRQSSQSGALLREAGEHVRRALSAVGEALDRWFTFGGALDPGHAHVLTCAMIGLLIGLVAWAAWRGAAALRRTAAARRRPAKPGERSAAHDTRPLTPEDLLARARAKAAIGEWQAAYRLAFACVLRALHRAAVISFNPTRTNGEYTRDLRGNEALSPWFVPLATEFDRLIYGRLPIGREETERCLAAGERSLALAALPDETATRNARA